MENYRIIETMCRIGLGVGGPAFRHQVQRLTEALRGEGDKKQADALEELLRSSEQAQTLKPSRLVQSNTAVVPGENLTERVSAPVDKETAAPLADIHFPEKLDPPVLDDVLSAAVDRLIEEWDHADKLIAIGAAPPRTCMLFGKPGTGKTMLAYYIADRLGVPLVLARLDGLVSSFLGTTARNIGALFDFASRYRCILLLDEFDALAKLRDDPQEVGEIKRVVNTLLQNIDKRTTQGFTMAITNHESLLDPAVWRRFEVRIQVPAPALDQRGKILSRYLQPLPVDYTSLRFLSWVSSGMTGSDLETMSKSIKRYMTIHGKGDWALIDALRAYAVTNATAEKDTLFHILLSSPQELARHIISDAELGLTQQDVGALLGKDQATISRWVRSDANPEKAVIRAE